MSQTSSSTKNNQIILRNRNRNKKYKIAIKKATKSYLLVLSSNNPQNLKICLDNLSLVYQKIDKAVKRKVLHKNTAARRKRRLARMLK
uniref:Ribosomal protein S20 n=1 Tax=Laurenciella marilzae TaxID=1413812 RepID=A0A1Z1M1Z3_9FLOR|nr:ribosomal protein S20 [Laurenciella marilzae]ARW59794.1 ribosomal protein S20 [Laurenciella marilzae]